MRYLIFLFVLISCSDKPIKIQNDVRFNYHKRLFQIYYKEYTNKTIKVNIPIMFGGGMMTSETIGYCQNTDPKYIVIDQSFWNRCSENEKETLIFHELGHCILGRPHKNSDEKQECPDSIMNFRIVPDKCYDLYKQQYLEELFNE